MRGTTLTGSEKSILKGNRRKPVEPLISPKDNRISRDVFGRDLRQSFGGFPKCPVGFFRRDNVSTAHNTYHGGRWSQQAKKEKRTVRALHDDGWNVKRDARGAVDFHPI
jgi:hypothetical protein